MTNKELIVDFLNWWDESVQKDPMRFETTNEDVAMMYLEEKGLQQSNTTEDKEERCECDWLFEHEKVVKHTIGCSKCKKPIL